MHLYTKFSLLCSAILVLAASSCVKTFDVADIKVTREGEEISFSASVSDWETKIYDNNDDF